MSEFDGPSRPCAECGRELATSVSVCPYCSASQPPVSEPAAVAARPEQRQRRPVLSRADRERIEAEEEYRAEVRARLAGVPKSDPPKPAEQNAGSGYAVVGCIGLVALLFLWPMFTSSSKPTGPAAPTKIDASVMAEEFVKKRLKSPGSAKFPWYDDSQVEDRGGGRFVVHSYVDSQNGFGALMRSDFRAVLVREADDTWKLEDMQLHTRE